MSHFGLYPTLTASISCVSRKEKEGGSEREEIGLKGVRTGCVDVFIRSSEKHIVESG